MKVIVYPMMIISLFILSGCELLNTTDPVLFYETYKRENANYIDLTVHSSNHTNYFTDTNNVSYLTNSDKYSISLSYLDDLKKVYLITDNRSYELFPKSKYYNYTLFNSTLCLIESSDYPLVIGVNTAYLKIVSPGGSVELMVTIKITRN